MKRKCTYCRKILTLDNTNFYNVKTRKFKGFSYGCKPCHNRLKTERSKIIGSPSYTKQKARVAVAKALKKGELQKIPCIICGEEKVHGHHFKGYKKKNWLDVIWLCQTHHLQAHNNGNLVSLNQKE